jgi:hypothetical protein
MGFMQRYLDRPVEEIVDGLLAQVPWQKVYLE